VLYDLKEDGGGEEEEDKDKEREAQPVPSLAEVQAAFQTVKLFF
jgi:hypothetical protein